MKKLEAEIDLSIFLWFGNPGCFVPAKFQNVNKCFKIVTSCLNFDFKAFFVNLVSGKFVTLQKWWRFCATVVAWQPVITFKGKNFFPTQKLSKLHSNGYWKVFISSFFLYRRTPLYAIDRDRKICLAYNKFPYKKTKDDCKLEDRFYRKASFSIAYTRIRR